MQNKILVYGIPIEGNSTASCLAELRKVLSSERKTPFLVFTPNLEMLARAKHSCDIRDLLKQGDLLLPDGIGIRILSRIRHKERIAGIDIGESLLSLSARKGYRVYLLGGKPGVAERAADALSARFPTLSVVGTHHGYFAERDESTVIKEICAASPDLLFVCMGFPRQEEFLARNRASLFPVRLALGLGGSIDIWSGKLCRAPVWMQYCGIEWLYRVSREPKRLSRLARCVCGILLPTRNQPKGDRSI